MNRNIIIILVVILAITIVSVAIWFIFRPQGSAPSLGGNGTAGNANSPTTIYKMPTSTTIMLGTPNGSVMVNNFYKNAVGAEEQFIVLAENNTYEITYDTNTNRFYIQVIPVTDAARQAGETAMLNLLGINQSEACKLDVGEGYGNQRLGLSFCSNGAFK